MNRNRLANARNPFQGDAKKVLTVCSAGLLRSPTAAWVLSNDPYNYNTRACGFSDEYALIVIDEALVFWADEIVCVEPMVELMIYGKGFGLHEKKVITLDIPDNYSRMDPELIDIIRTQYDEASSK